jgi:PAS domain S-box-containing protein
MNTTATILLVDDLEENLIAMAALLRAPEVRVVMARSGTEALEIVLVNEVALALVDVQMPDMDGFELAELMRGSERTKYVPIVFITAGAHDRQRQFKGFNFGAVDFLYKPVEPHVLTSKVAVFVELFRQKKALSRVSALQNAIFNSANFSSIATDANGVIQIFNVGAERMLGYTANEVMNKITPADISDPQEVVERACVLSLELDTVITPGFEALVFKASRGMEDIYELTYIRKDGSRFPAVVSVTALRDAQDAIIGYLLIGTDNTARKRVEDERREIEKLLQQKNTELEVAIAVADKANRAKSDFLSSMSHELRTPLNAILGFAQLIEAGLPPPSFSQKRSVDQILKAGWYLLELINEILDLAMIESDRVTLSQEPVSLHEVLLECQGMVETQAKTRGIGMTFPHIEKHCFVFADRIRIKQVLVNFLSNAIKYNRADGSVSVESALCPPHSIRIGVRDTGYGLTPEQLAQLFEPFNRLGRERGSEEGTGIGLVVTKRLVELMGGRTGVDSVVGVGSVFWFELELTCAAVPCAVQAAHMALAPATSPIDPLVHTLLYVEDNPANLDLVEQLIARRADLNLLTATNGPTGIELARTSLPKVILMDINLPGMSGIDAMQVLRAEPLTAQIPVIAVSANASKIDIENGIKAGFFSYVTKPIRVSDFMKSLDDALEHSKAL